MANYCYFKVRAVSEEKESLDCLWRALTTAYDYRTSEDGKYIHYPDNKHFSRVFEYSGEMYQKDDNYYLEGDGNCAWSVYSCMQKGDLTYFETMNKQGRNVTCLEDMAKKYPKMKIEIISEEPGMAFSEHVVVDNGIVTNTHKPLVSKYNEEDENGTTNIVYTELPE